MSRRQRPSGRGKQFRRRSEKKREHHSHGKPGKFFQGRVQKNPRGFAFIVPLHAEFEDAFVSPEQAGKLMDGDIVEFSIQSRGRRSSAQIRRVVTRRTEEILGKIVPGRRGWAVVTPNQEFFALEGDDAGTRPGDWVLAKMTTPPGKEIGGVEITESFGRFLSPKNDISITIARFGLINRFTDGLLRDADRYRKLAQDEVAHLEGRKDLRHLPFVTIDGEDAKDFDDAVFVGKTDGAGFTLYVAIADVSFFVRPGTQLDKEAKARSTSVYFPGFCLPMLPEFLSNDLCSLRPQEDKLSVTAEIRFSGDGHAQAARFYPSLIKTARRLTYTQVQAFVDKEPATLRELAPLAKHLENARALYRLLDSQRRKRGVLDFDLPESKIEVDKDGKPISLKRAPRFESHKLIEEFMITANRAVAKYLRESKAMALYRVHEPPDPDKLDELNAMLRNLGMSERITEVSPRAFARVLASTANLGASGTVHHLILRLQKQAHYEPQPKGHFGLALADYAHFTSPIRRYPDLVVHRALKGLIERRPKADKRSEGVSSDDYVRLGDHTSQQERLATEAERFIVRRKQCWFFSERVGDLFDGVVSGVTQNGVFVSLSEYAADGFVPIEFLDGFYELDEKRMCLRKRPGTRTIGLGDSLRVQVVKVTVDENQITLGLAENE